MYSCPKFVMTSLSLLVCHSKLPQSLIFRRESSLGGILIILRLNFPASLLSRSSTVASFSSPTLPAPWQGPHCQRSRTGQPVVHCRRPGSLGRRSARSWHLAWPCGFCFSSSCSSTDSPWTPRQRPLRAARLRLSLLWPLHTWLQSALICQEASFHLNFSLMLLINPYF